MPKLHYVPFLFCAVLITLAQPPAWAQQAASLINASCQSATLTCTWQVPSNTACSLFLRHTESGGSCDTPTTVLTSDGLTQFRCNPTVQFDQNCTMVIASSNPFLTANQSSNIGPTNCLGGSDPSSGFTSGDGGRTSDAPNCSPIIIDIGEEGFHLTSAQNGVSFDITGTGQSVKIAWTDPHFRNAFLALPGPDGLVHNGRELFGNFTPQPPSDHPNGFLALAEYDRPENGGNGDGIIDERDAVFSRLRLWIDENHDGVSQPNELHTLSELGVASISLMYHLSRKEDQYGNVFRYRARVNPIPPDDQAEVGKAAYDILLTAIK